MTPRTDIINDNNNNNNNNNNNKSFIYPGYNKQQMAGLHCSPAQRLNK